MSATPPTIYALTVSDWNYPWWVDRQHLLSRLCKRGWPVLYSNGPLNLWDRGSRHWRNAGWTGEFESVQVGPDRNVMLDRPGKVWPLWPKSPMWNRFAYRRNAARLLRASGDRASGAKRIAFVCYPTFLPYVEDLDPDWVVLHVNDAWCYSSGWTAGLERNLAKLVERADLITCVAQTMADTLPGDGPRRAKILPHGVDVDAVVEGAKHACPKELQDIPSPRIAYMGRISDKVDLTLIASIAIRRPNWHWVVIGSPVASYESGGEHEAALRHCESLVNVHFLGPRSQSEIPRYLAHVDVHALCYKYDEKGYWTAGFPLKIYEVLATGKPVVATALASMRGVENEVALVKTEDEWVDAIESALDGRGAGTLESRSRVALENTWDKRTDMLEGWLKSMMGSSSRGPR